MKHPPKPSAARDYDLAARLTRRVWLLAWAGCLSFWLAACSGGSGAEPASPEPTAAPESTPTLVRALTDLAPPTPPVTPFTASGDGPAVAPPPTAAHSADPMTPGPTLTPSATPTATPPPADRLRLGQTHLHNQHYAAAAEQFHVALAQVRLLSRQQRAEALYGLGLATLWDGRPQEAADALNEHLALVTAEGGSLVAPNPAAYFHLADAYLAINDCPAALAAFQSYLDGNADLAAYVFPRMAECHAALGDREATVAAYESALASTAHRIVIVAIRQRLASYYLEDGDYAAAVAQYDAILEIAQTENTRGQSHYQAGAAHLLAGNSEAGYQRYLEAVNSYPRAYESYLALIALIEAGYEVNPFQRGLVDYYARAFQPAVAAFQDYLAANPDAHREDAHLYLAWSYEALGNVQAAVAEIDVYIEAMAAHTAEAARGWTEKAEIHVRSGNNQAALEAYQTVSSAYAASSYAPAAGWWVAMLTERLGDPVGAAGLYRQLADTYPGYNRAPEALFRAGLMELDQGNQEAAVAHWERLTRAYPNHEYGAAAIVWLIKHLGQEQAAPYVALAASRQGASYYILRAQHIAAGAPPFQPPASLRLDFDQPAEQAEAESWLAGRLGLESTADLSALPPALAEDPRLVVGQKLWQLGLYDEAKRELEALRTAHADDALANYRLAIFLRDLGLYRSSIIAAATVLNLTGVTAFDAPKFIAQLAFPIYYHDLILPLAGQYGFDPLLQFALVRQESLFESFATSSAVAQGLSQVIPDTGAHIAQRLAWPDYRNEDLYRPYVGLAFGAYYLQEQLRAFDGNVSAALAAYNGGPGNAARWLRMAPDDPDRFLESVNFAETRAYIERIYVGHAIYRHLYGDGT